MRNGSVPCWRQKPERFWLCQYERKRAFTHPLTQLSFLCTQGHGGDYWFKKNRKKSLLFCSRGWQNVIKMKLGRFWQLINAFTESSSWSTLFCQTVSGFSFVFQLVNLSSFSSLSHVFFFLSLSSSLESIRNGAAAAVTARLCITHQPVMWHR